MYPLTDIALLCRRGHHRVAVEPALRHHRSQACPSGWCTWHNDGDDPVWIVAIILDIGLEVNMPLRAVIEVLSSLNAVKPIPCRRAKWQHRRYEEYVGGNSR